MSFFEIEPMGAKHYGGINVGGMPMGGMVHMPQYGGMYGAMGGARKGQVFTEGELEAMKAKRSATSTEVFALADELYKQGGRTVSSALAEAKAMVKASRKISRPRVARPKKGEAGYKPAVRHGADWYGAHPSAISSIKARLNSSKRGSILTGKKALQSDLAELDAWLSQKGYGIHDLQGSAWYDDVFGVIKDVAHTAIPFAKYLI